MIRYELLHVGSKVQWIEKEICHEKTASESAQRITLHAAWPGGTSVCIIAGGQNTVAHLRRTTKKFTCTNRICSKLQI